MPYPAPWPAEVAEGLIDIQIQLEEVADLDGHRSEAELEAIATVHRLQDRVEEIDTALAEYVSVLRTGRTRHWHTRRRQSRNRMHRELTHA